MCSRASVVKASESLHQPTGPLVTTGLAVRHSDATGPSELKVRIFFGLLAGSIAASTVFSGEAPLHSGVVYPHLEGAAVGLRISVVLLGSLLILVSFRSLRWPTVLIACASLAVTTSSVEGYAAAVPLIAVVAAKLDQATWTKVCEVAGRLLAASLAIGLLLTPVFNWTMLGGRFQGVFGNPNSAAAASALLSFLAYRSARWEWLLLAFIAGTAAGGRTFFLTTSSVFAYCWLQRDGIFAHLMSLTLRRYLLLCGFVPLVGFLQTTALGRTNSLSGRSQLWSNGISLTIESLPFGIGYSSLEKELSNALMVISVELGLLGILIGVLAQGLVALRSIGSFASNDAVRGIFLATMLLTTYSEGWMFAGGSFIALTFWTLALQPLVRSLPPAQSPLDLEAADVATVRAST